MAAKRFGKTALSALAAVWGAAGAAEIEPIEYQASVDIEALLKDVAPAMPAAPVGNSGHFADATSAPDVRAGLHI